jgi:hypothetical protein
MSRARTGTGWLAWTFGPVKLDLIQQAKTPVVEEGMVELVAQAATAPRPVCTASVA